MEIHQLRYFIAVAQERSFSRAAERVRVAQPSLSQQIQKLEGEVGVPLFDRLNRKVALTEAGTALLPFAERILNELRDAQRCLTDQGELAGGVARIGMIPTIAPFIVEELFARARKELPGLAVHLIEGVTDQLVDSVERGEIDLAVISSCSADQALHLERVSSEPLVVALSKKHLLAKARAVRWSDLKNERIVTLQESHCLSRQVLRACRARGIVPGPELPLLQLPTLMALVGAGEAVSFVPQMALKRPLPSCVFRELKTNAPQRELNLLRNPGKYQSKAARALAEIARSLLLNAGAKRSPREPKLR